MFFAVPTCRAIFTSKRMSVAFSLCENKFEHIHSWVTLSEGETVYLLGEMLYIRQVGKSSKWMAGC